MSVMLRDDETEAAPLGRPVHVVTQLADARHEPRQRPDEVIVHVPISHIDVADNVRGDLGDLTAMVESVREEGVLVPLTLRPRTDAPGRYTVVFGHRRLGAAILAQRADVPCIVRREYVDVRGRTVAMAVEALQRKGLTVTEEARVYARLSELSLSQRQIGHLCGCHQSHVSVLLALLRLPAVLLSAVENGQLSAEAGTELSRLLSRTSRLDGHEDRLQSLLEDIRGGETPMAALENQVRRLGAEERAERNRLALRQQGVTILEARTDEERADQWYAAPGPRRLGMRYREIHVGLVAHAALPCHAAAISPRTGEIVWLCTTPASHGRVEEDEDQLRKALGRSRKRREGEYSEQLRARPADLCPADSTRMAAVLIDTASVSVCRRAARWLGLAGGKEALQEWAGDPSNLARAAMAICIAMDEALAREDNAAAVRRVLDDAAHRDGGLDPAEQAWLERCSAA